MRAVYYDVEFVLYGLQDFEVIRVCIVHELANVSPEVGVQNLVGTERC